MKKGIKRLLGIFKYVEINNKLYFYARRELGICIYDKKTEELTCRSRKVETEDFACYSDAVYIGGKIFFAPYLSKRILIYDINKETEEYVELDRPLLSNKVLVYGAKLFFFSNELPQIVEYDPEIGELVIFGLPVVISACSVAEINEPYVYACTKEEDKLLRINLDERKSEVVSLESYHCRYSTISFYDSYFLLSGTGHYVIKWNYKSGECMKIELPQSVSVLEKKNDGIAYFSSSVVIGNSIILSPKECHFVVKIDPIRNEAESIYKLADGLKTINAQIWNGDRIFISAEDMNYEVVLSLVIDLNGSITKENVFEYNSTLAFFRESSVVGLQEFINCIYED